MEDAENTRFIYQFGKFTLDPQEKTLFAGGKPLHLPAKEFETLLLLVQNNGKALSKEQMINLIWQDSFVEEGNLAKQISRLRKVFNTDGKKLIETLPKHGYRFSADINRILQPDEETILERRTIKKLTVNVEQEFDDDPRFLPRAKARFSYRYMLAIASFAVLAGVFGIWYWSIAATPAKINSIAVLPLKPLSSDVNNAELGLGLADALITKLSSLRTISVRPTSSVVNFTATDTDALAVGRKLNVDAILEGTIQQSEGRIRINARLLNIATGEQIWSEIFDESTNEIFALQDSLSNKIARTLAFELKKSEVDELTARPTQNAEAFEKFLRGRFYQRQNTDQGLTRSIEFYEQAIALDPGFADAHAGIADSYLLLYNFGLRPADDVIPKVRQSLKRAMLLNPNLSQAHLTSAQFELLYERDFEKADRSYQESIRLSPNNADAYLRYGYFLTSLGRFDESLAKLEKGIELNPLSTYVKLNIALVSLCRKDYPATIEKLEKIIAENPELAFPHWLLAGAYEMSGEPEKAFASNMHALGLDGNPDLAGKLRMIRDERGLRVAYETWYAETEKLREKGFVSAIQLATIAALLKDREKTLTWLEKSEQEHEATLWQIKFVEWYDFLRDEPRFQNLIRKIELKRN